MSYADGGKPMPYKPNPQKEADDRNSNRSAPKQDHSKDGNRKSLDMEKVVRKQ
jgi:hypothetical protein